MRPFDPTKLRVTTTFFKTGTTALGGSIRVSDDKNCKLKEFTRIPAPMGVVRAFGKKWKTLQYFMPVLIAITWYDDRIVALERHVSIVNDDDYTDLDGNQTEWISTSHTNVEKYQSDDLSSWLCDGSYLYENPKDVNGGELLSSDGKFTETEVSSIQLSQLSSTTMSEKTRSSLGLLIDGKIFYTPPIWMSLRSVGISTIAKENIDDEVPVFDTVDNFLSVNLAFAIFTSRALRIAFNPDVIVPMQIPSLMIQLQTCNLSSLSKNIKHTYDIGMSFTSTISWLIGLINQPNLTDDQFFAIRSAMRFLTNKGMYKRTTYTTIFSGDANKVNVVSIKELISNIG